MTFHAGSAADEQGISNTAADPPDPLVSMTIYTTWLMPATKDATSGMLFFLECCFCCWWLQWNHFLSGFCILEKKEKKRGGVHL